MNMLCVLISDYTPTSGSAKVSLGAQLRALWQLNPRHTQREPQLPHTLARILHSWMLQLSCSEAMTWKTGLQGLGEVGRQSLSPGDIQEQGCRTLVPSAFLS